MKTVCWDCDDAAL